MAVLLQHGLGQVTDEVVLAVAVRRVGELCLDALDEGVPNGEREGVNSERQWRKEEGKKDKLGAKKLKSEKGLRNPHGPVFFAGHAVFFC